MIRGKVWVVHVVEIEHGEKGTQFPVLDPLERVLRYDCGHLSCGNLLELQSGNNTHLDLLADRGSHHRVCNGPEIVVKIHKSPAKSLPSSKHPFVGRKSGCAIAGLEQNLGKPRGGCIAREGQGLHLTRQTPSEQRAMGGYGPGRGGNSSLKQDALHRQPVKNRRGGPLISHGRNAVGPQGVNHDQQYVRASGRRHGTAGQTVRPLPRGNSDDRTNQQETKSQSGWEQPLEPGDEGAPPPQEMPAANGGESQRQDQRRSTVQSLQCKQPAEPSQECAFRRPRAPSRFSETACTIHKLGCRQSGTEEHPRRAQSKAPRTIRCEDRQEGPSQNTGKARGVEPQ